MQHERRRLTGLPASHRSRGARRAIAALAMPVLAMALPSPAAAAPCDQDFAASPQFSAADCVF
jgi:hypothetical protein